MGVLYKIRGKGLKAEDLVIELNGLLQELSEVLDQVRGLRGDISWHNRAITNHDIVIGNNSKGLVLRDTANPANYWRVTVDSTGSLQVTNLGRNYK